MTFGERAGSAGGGTGQAAIVRFAMNEHAREPIALRSIALFEIAKGILALAAAFGLLSLRNTDLLAATDAFLFRHGIDPDTPYRRLFIESVAKAAKLPIGQVVGFALAYAVVRFAEGFGLWFAKHWAEWFAVISAALYLPLEFRHLARRPSLLTAIIILLNLAIIWYLIHLLFQERARRRRHPRAKARSP
jgi:uncharacterized membrane protein (DUF2068 family)